MYEISCKDCNGTYISQTLRQLKTRTHTHTHTHTHTATNKQQHEISIWNNGTQTAV